MNKQILIASIASLIALSACGGPKIRRTQETDAMLRVLIDPRIDVANYVEIRRALVQSGKFEVIDRKDGFEAALAEQDLQFRSGMSDRFADREKWGRIGQMYGAQGIISAHAQCYGDMNMWNRYKRTCKQDLAFIDGATGKVEFAVAGENSVDWTGEFVAPDWNDVVEKFADSYPEYFTPRIVKHPLDTYMDQSEEYSRREREKQSPAPRAPTIVKTEIISAKDVKKSEEKFDAQ